MARQILIWYFLATGLCLQGQTRIPVVPDANIVIDGLFEENAWQSAYLFPIHAHIKVYFFQTADCIFIGVRSVPGMPCYTDLYLADGKNILNLHASMQLGERQLPPEWNDETPPWDWGNNAKWVANTVTFKPSAVATDPFPEQVVAYDGQEFKIMKSRLAGNRLTIRLEAKSFTDKDVHFSYPPNSQAADTASWAQFLL